MVATLPINMIMTVLEPLAVDRTRWPWRTNSRGFLEPLCASDTMSCCEQWPLDVRDALLNEFQHGTATIKFREMFSGAAFGADSVFWNGAPRPMKMGNTRPP